ncbi:tryptophan synthase subunit alpha [Oerskovia sp. M15]
MLEDTLLRVREGGSKSLLGYVMGGVRDDWADLVRAMVDGGADAVEIGIPFSDPMLDGEVIQHASLAALRNGARLERILDELPDTSAPLVAMTYANHLASRGALTYLRAIAAAGISGSIVADLPFEESSSYVADAHTAGVAPVLMVAPRHHRRRRTVSRRPAAGSSTPWARWRRPVPRTTRRRTGGPSRSSCDRPRGCP